MNISAFRGVSFNHRVAQPPRFRGAEQPQPPVTAEVVYDDTFQDAVLRSDKPVLAYFYTRRYDYYDQAIALVNALGEEFRDKLKVVAVNILDNPMLAQKYNVTATPHMIFFKKGRKSREISGLDPEAMTQTALKITA